jgi:hypothetical protein
MALVWINMFGFTLGLVIRRKRSVRDPFLSRKWVTTQVFFQSDSKPCRTGQSRGISFVVPFGGMRPVAFELERNLAAHLNGPATLKI